MLTENEVCIVQPNRNIPCSYDKLNLLCYGGYPINRQVVKKRLMVNPAQLILINTHAYVYGIRFNGPLPFLLKNRHSTSIFLIKNGRHLV